MFDHPICPSCQRARPARSAGRAPGGASSPRAIFILALLFVFALLFVTAPFAAADEPAEAIVTSERIEVVSTAAELASEIGIEPEALEERQVTDTGAGLREVTGADAIRRGPVNLDPQVRGLSGARLLVLVDDTRTFAAGPGGMDSALAHVGPHALAALRVVKGPQALSWGAGALAAVRVETDRPAFTAGPFAWDGRVGLGFGDNSAATDGYLTLRGSDDRWRFAVTAGYRAGDDYEAGDGSVVPGGFTSADTRWALGYEASARLRVDYRGGYQDQDEIDYPGRLLDADYFVTRSHALEVAWQPGRGVDEVDGGLYSNRKRHRMNNDGKPSARPMPGRVPPFGLDVDLPTESDTSGGHLRLGGRTGAWSWRSGIDAYHLDQTATRFISRRDSGVLLFEDRIWPDVTIDHTGVWGQASWGGAVWVASGTVRVDAEEATATDASDFFLEHAGSTLDQGETTVSAALSAVRRWGDGLRLSIGLGRVARMPTALERYADRFPSTTFQVAAEHLGNPALEPEVSLQLDLGLHLESADGRLAGAVGLFVREVDDAVTVAVDPELPRHLPTAPTSVYRYVNGEASFVGGEVELRHRPHPAWSWGLGASWIRGDDDTFDEPAFGVPPLTTRVDLRWTSPADRVWVGCLLTWADAQARVATARAEQPTPSWATVDLATGIELGRGWTVRAGVRNLLDETYARHLSSLDPFSGTRVPEPGRELWAGVELRF